MHSVADLLHSILCNYSQSWCIIMLDMYVICHTQVINMVIHVGWHVYCTLASILHTYTRCCVLAEYDIREQHSLNIINCGKNFFFEKCFKHTNSMSWATVITHIMVCIMLLALLTRSQNIGEIGCAHPLERTMIKVTWDYC